MTTLPVFLVERLPDGPQAVLDGPEGHHAATVRRLRVGESLVLCDGRGGLARCAVRDVGRDTVTLAVDERWIEPAPQLRVVLAQALAKGNRGELAVELATEAGVDEILPWRAARCVVTWDDGPRGDRALGKWRSTAREAAKQARRAWCPPVGDPLATPALADRARAAALTLVLHESADRGLGDVTMPTAGDLLLVVGPEGGITESEIAVLGSAGAVPVRLGPTVLRTSTAAAVALGAIGPLTRRWE
ncbi:MAG TPA: 16S rRNA (uracil(1498)-N(3))-methyltransferase [Pseudonocardiaceae bacterium]|nr:16S rRNA (uracil(1498)-N(3))-methyltransferase [Pseudonocardiaceae bacterium]